MAGSSCRGTIGCPSPGRKSLPQTTNCSRTLIIDVKFVSNHSKSEEVTMRLTICFLVACIWVGLKPAQVYGQPGFGHVENINDGWAFKLGDMPEGEQPGEPDRSWERLDLPHDWSVKQPLSPTLASATGYLPGGIGWYRKTLSVPNEYRGQQLYIYFEGVYNHSEVFINGQSLGKRPNGYISFMYDLTPHVRYGQENILTVRVDHSDDAD